MDLRPYCCIPSLLLVSILSLFGCGGQSHEEKESSAQKVDGERIYQERCASCHGRNGKKGVSGAKDLTRSELSMKERIRIIKNGKGAMIPFEGVLNDKETRAVARYLDQFKEGE